MQNAVTIQPSLRLSWVFANVCGEGMNSYKRK